MLSLPVNCTDIMEQLVTESFCLFLYFFRELNFKEIEAYNRLQNVDCVSLPNIKDQVSGGSIDCVTLPNIKDLVSGLSIDWRKMDMMVVGAGSNVKGGGGGGHFFQAQYGE